MSVLNTYGMASAANCVGIGLASVAIFGLHHRLWRRIGSSRRRPLDEVCETAVWRAIRPRPVVSVISEPGRATPPSPAGQLEGRRSGLASDAPPLSHREARNPRLVQLVHLPSGGQVSLPGSTAPKVSTRHLPVLRSMSRRHHGSLSRWSQTLPGNGQ